MKIGRFLVIIFYTFGPFLLCFLYLSIDGGVVGLGFVIVGAFTISKYYVIKRNIDNCYCCLSILTNFSLDFLWDNFDNIFGIVNKK